MAVSPPATSPIALSPVEAWLVGIDNGIDNIAANGLPDPLELHIPQKDCECEGSSSDGVAKASPGQAWLGLESESMPDAEAARVASLVERAATSIGGEPPSAEAALLGHICFAVECYMTGSESTAASLLDLLRVPAIAPHFEGMRDTLEQLQTLQQAVATSQLIQVAGSRVVFRTTWAFSAGMPATWLDVASEAAPGGNPDTLGGAFPVYLTDFGDGVCPVPIVGWLDQAEHCTGPVASQHEHADRTNPRRCRKTPKDRTVDWLAYMLKSPCPEMAELMKKYDGSMLLTDLFRMNHVFAASHYDRVDIAIKFVLDTDYSPVEVDPLLKSVKLVSNDVLIQHACERFIRSKRQGSHGGSMESAASVEELLAHEDIACLVEGFASSSSEEPAPKTNAERLLDALQDSHFMEVSGEGAIEEGQVSLKPPDVLVCGLLEAVFASDPMVKGFLETDGEVSLEWFLKLTSVQRLCRRCDVPGKLALDVAQRAAQVSQAFTLTQSGMSVYPRGCAEQSALQNLPKDIKILAQPAPRRSPLKPIHLLRRVPREKHATDLRHVLDFYFQPFNLQHVRVLLAAVHAQRITDMSTTSRRHNGFLRNEGRRPVFSLEELRALPRVARVLDQYESDVVPVLVAAALQTGTCLPVRVRRDVSSGAGRGAWTLPEPVLELSYIPDLRIVDGEDMSRPEVMSLVSRGPSASQPLTCLPKAAVCVVSYCVSSDLSHSESPKAAGILPKLSEAGVDPTVLAWGNRQPKIVRQLMLHGPDIICLQGIQSLGFVERHTDDASSWFHYKGEPATNHLAHIYDDLASHNYAGYFAPTLKLPDSDSVCFGNAVFWKRSRFALERTKALSNAGACVELTSRHGGPSVVACSSKSAAVFARDWAGVATDDEIAASFQDVQGGLEEMLREAKSDEAQPLWCGDFGMDSESLIDTLSTDIATLPPSWRSACKSALGRDLTVTSFLSSGQCASTDFLLHDHGLHVSAGFSGFKEDMSLLDFLCKGYPSDHVLQMALFVGQSSDHSSTTASSGEEEKSDSWKFQ